MNNSDKKTIMNANLADFTTVGNPEEIFNLDDWYRESGVECSVTIRSAGAAKVPDDMTTSIPKASQTYKIGFSLYCTLDEVGTMMLESMKTAAEEAGVELLVNNANYDQNAQNQAINQWIQQSVDGIILGPCDFTGVKTALDALEEANIPVITLNAPLAGNVDAVVISDTVEQGKIAGELLEEAILAAGKKMKGVIIYQTLPFMHPNAVTRAKGFIGVFKKYPDIMIVERTGVSSDEHYEVFKSAIKNHPDMLGAWGLYSAATIGMLKAKFEKNRRDILLSSIDQDKLVLKGIFDGDVVGTAAYSSIAPARWCLSQVVNLLNGAKIPGVLFYANMAVTKDNVQSAFEHYYPGKTLSEYIKGEK